MQRFQNRAEAGKVLAAAIAAKGYADPVILALPRGGVPVAIEVTRELHAPLDLLMVRKIGAPDQPELAVGAVVNGDHPEFETNIEVARALGLTPEDVEQMANARLEEIRRRRAKYLDGRQQVPIDGRTAIIVDDGIATGATVRVAIKALRRRSPKAIILAVPVAPVEVINTLRSKVDDIVCLATPVPFWAVGAHYSDFQQTTDEEVTRLLIEASLISDQARKRPPGRP